CPLHRRVPVLPLERRQWRLQMIGPTPAMLGQYPLPEWPQRPQLRWLPRTKGRRQPDRILERTPSRGGNPDEEIVDAIPPEARARICGIGRDEHRDRHGRAEQQGQRDIGIVERERHESARGPSSPMAIYEFRERYDLTQALHELDRALELRRRHVRRALRRPRRRGHAMVAEDRPHLPTHDREHPVDRRRPGEDLARPPAAGVTHAAGEHWIT